MEKDNYGWGNWLKVTKNKKQKSTSRNRGAVALSRAPPGFASQNSNNTITSVSKSGKILTNNVQQTSCTSNYWGDARLNADSKGSYGKNLEETGPGQAFGVLETTDPLKKGDIQNCVKLLSEIHELSTKQFKLFQDFTNEATIYWKEEEKTTVAGKLNLKHKSESQKPKKFSKNCVPYTPNSFEEIDTRKKEKEYNEMYFKIYKHLINDQQLMDNSLSIVSNWCEIGNEYNLSCQLLLRHIFHNWECLLSGAKVNKRDDIIDKICSIVEYFRRVKKAGEEIETSFINIAISDSLIDQYVSSKRHGSVIDLLSRIKEERAQVFKNAMEKRKELKKGVQNLTGEITEKIEQVDLVVKELESVISNHVRRISKN